MASSFLSGAEFKDAISDILAGTGITSFSRIRVFRDGTASGLSTDDRWHESVVKACHYGTLPAYGCDVDRANRRLWINDLYMHQNRPEFYAHAGNFINTETAMTVVRSNDLYTDRIILANQRPDRKLLEYFVNYHDGVDRIIDSVGDRASLLYQQADQYRHKVASQTARVSPLNQFIDINSLNRYLSTYLELPVRLNKTEVICISFMLLGLNNKSIADQLKLSVRTIDNTMQSIRYKLRCTSSKGIASIIFYSGAHRIYFLGLLGKSAWTKLTKFKRQTV